MVNAWPQVIGQIMVLSHTGRRTGRQRRTPLNYLKRDGVIYAVAGFGPATDWYRNVRANPQVVVWLPGSASPAPCRTSATRRIGSRWCAARRGAAGSPGPRGVPVNVGTAPGGDAGGDLPAVRRRVLRQRRHAPRRRRPQRAPLTIQRDTSLIMPAGPSPAATAWVAEWAASQGYPLSPNLQWRQTTSRAWLGFDTVLVVKVHPLRTDRGALGTRVTAAASPQLRPWLVAPLTTVVGCLPDHPRPVTLWPLVPVLDPDQADPLPWASIGAHLAGLHRATAPAGLPEHGGPLRVRRALDRAAPLSAMLRSCPACRPGSSARCRPVRGLEARG